MNTKGCAVILGEVSRVALCRLGVRLGAPDIAEIIEAPPPTNTHDREAFSGSGGAIEGVGSHWANGRSPTHPRNIFGDGVGDTPTHSRTFLGYC